MIKKISVISILFVCLISCSRGYPDPPINSYRPFDIPQGNIQLIFSVTSDAQWHDGDNINFFRHACERIAIGGQGDFMISPGDMVPLPGMYATIQTYIGSDYTWYPVIGNHELDISEGETEPPNMTWLRNFNLNGNTLPHIVNTGPPGCEETTYSFNYGITHFVVLNEYYDGFSDTGTDGDIVDALHAWLVEDLTRNENPLVLVFGHEPAFPQPDEESGRIRHEYDSLDQYPENRDRFWNTLSDFGVKAYICGHTHNYSSVLINNVWHIEDGHAKGLGDTGSPSTFIMFYIMGNRLIIYHVYRLNLDENRYELTSIQQID